MKILVIQPSCDKMGHFGVYTVNLCQELSRLGNTVTLFTGKVYPEKFLIDKPIFEIIEYKNGRYTFDKFDAAKKKNPIYYALGYLRNSFIIFRAALKHAQGKNYDVIQILDTEYGTASLLVRWYARKLPPVSLLINAPNFSFSEYAGAFVIKLYKEFQNRVLRLSLGTGIKGIVTIGDFHEQQLRKQLHLPKEFPMVVTHDGAHPPKVILTKSEARKKFGIDYDGTLFLFFGMLRKDKGIETLLEALSLITDRPCKLLIVGSLFDYEEKDILSLIKKFNIEDRVITRFGFIDEDAKYDGFFASDALILPYVKLYRGGSGPLLKEAAICSVPSIVSDVSEMGLLVKKYQLGLAAEAENPESLAASMRQFLDMSPVARQELATNAFRAALTWTKMAQDYESLYKRII